MVSNLNAFLIYLFHYIEASRYSYKSCMNEVSKMGCSSYETFHRYSNLNINAIKIMCVSLTNTIIALNFIVEAKFSQSLSLIGSNNHVCTHRSVAVIKSFWRFCLDRKSCLPLELALKVIQPTNFSLTFGHLNSLPKCNSAYKRKPGEINKRFTFSFTKLYGKNLLTKWHFASALSPAIQNIFLCENISTCWAFGKKIKYLEI